MVTSPSRAALAPGVAFPALLVIGTVWGSTMPLTKLAVSTGHPSLGLTVWQMALFAGFLAPVLIWRGRMPPLHRRAILFYVGIALLGTALPNLTSYAAYRQLPAGVMALVLALIPMFALAVALVARLERFSPVRLAGISLGLAAVALIVLPGSALPDAGQVRWIPLALIAPFLYGVEGNFASVARPDDTTVVDALVMSSLIGLVLTAPVAFATGMTVDLSPPWGVAEWAFLGSIGLHLVAYGGYLWLVARAGGVFTAQVSYIVTPVGMIAAMVVLGEAPSPWLWAALSLVILGLALVSPRRTAG